MIYAYSSLTVRIEDRVAEIVLDRADARNAVNHAMHHELVDAFTRIVNEPAVRAIVFAANGRVFSAGGDFELILEDRQHPERREDMAANGRALFAAVCTCPLPVIVALQGDAVGLGATLVLGGDAVIAARTARISDPHVAIGLVAGDGGCVLWPQSAGLLRAKRYLLTGDRLTAEDAFAMGLVSDLVDTPDEVRPAAHALARRIAALPPQAVQRTKKVLNDGLRKQMGEVFEASLQGELDTFFSNDVGEAIAAIREKRAGDFTGS